jgi:TPR repeat protein
MFEKDPKLAYAFARKPNIKDNEDKLAYWYTVAAEKCISTNYPPVMCGFSNALSHDQDFVVKLQSLMCAAIAGSAKACILLAYLHYTGPSHTFNVFVAGYDKSIVTFKNYFPQDRRTSYAWLLKAFKCKYQKRLTCGRRKRAILLELDMTTCTSNL